MVALFSELDELIKKYDKDLNKEEYILDSPKPVMIPDDVYDEICASLKTKEIGLLGIS